MRFRQDPGKAGAEIEAAEVEGAEFIVVKLLVLDRERAVKGLRYSRRVSHSGRWREHDIRLLAVSDQRHVGGVIERRRQRNAERLVTFHPLQDLLFADIG